MSRPLATPPRTWITADQAPLFRVRQTPLRELLPRLGPALDTSWDPLVQALSAGRVRGLLDSMYRGYPIGHVAIAHSPPHPGQGPRAARPKVIDGMDMLAGLAQAMLGLPAHGANDKPRIAIAFKPTTEAFLVRTPSSLDDPECIPDIARVLCAGASRYRLVGDYLDRLAAWVDLDEGTKETLSLSIDRLIGLAGYPVTVFEFPPGVPEELAQQAVSRLSASRLTLRPEDIALAETGCIRPSLIEQVHRFCRDCRRPPQPGRPSPFNHILRPAPQDMVVAALASPCVAAPKPDDHPGAASGPTLCGRLDQAMDLVCWHGFLTAMAKAGYRGAALVGSRRAAFEAYGGYLSLKRSQTPPALRDRLAALLYLCRALTPAVLTTACLGHLPDDLELAIGQTLDQDFFRRRLPALLSRPGTKTAAFLAFLAAQARLGAPVLFSTARVGDLLDYGFSSGKKALERHHIHPRHHLHALGLRDPTRIDRPGNLALIEWPDNTAIADQPPPLYVPRLRRRFKAKAWERMLRLNALWPGFEHEPYDAFLTRREVLMADLIRQACLDL